MSIKNIAKKAVTKTAKKATKKAIKKTAKTNPKRVTGNKILKTAEKSVKKASKSVVKESGSGVPKETARAKIEKPVGEVVHYYGHIGVVVIELLDTLEVGDKIRIKGGEDTDFAQEVKSIEIDHRKVKKAQPGSSIGLKIGKKAREGYKVYKT